VPPREFES